MSYSMRLKAVYVGLLDIIFPRVCPVCLQIASPRGFLVCQSCLSKLSFVKAPYCLKCGKELMFEEESFCKDCKDAPKTYAYGVALLNYDVISQRAMAKIKYNGKREFIEPLAKLLILRYKDRIQAMKVDVLMPVPIHKSRYRERGFNQAQVLAFYIEKEMEIPMCDTYLYREKKTIAQKNLGATQRLQNLKQAFFCHTLPSHIKRVLLVDDIYTTGSTIEACSQAIKKAGAKEVFFVTLCIGEDI